MTASTQVNVSQDQSDIRELMASREAAMRSGDAALLTSHYTPDLVLFSLAPPLQYHGPNEAGLREWFAGFGGSVGFEIRDLEVTSDGDVAFCHSLNRLYATPVGTSDSFSMWFRSTVGLRRIDGSWRISHEHQSTPFYMDGSFGAALDLEP